MGDWQQTLGEHLLAGRVDALVDATRAALAAGHTAQQVLDEAMMPAMHRLGERFADGDAFLPELLLAADTMKGAMTVLESVVGEAGTQPRGTVVLGTIAGDIHDLGKNLVAMMLRGAGFRVVDLGTSVATRTFLEAYERENANLVGVSSLLTSTMVEMGALVRQFREAHPAARVMVGGAPVTQEFADQIGAAGYAPDAHAAVGVAVRILGPAPSR